MPNTTVQAAEEEIFKQLELLKSDVNLEIVKYIKELVHHISSQAHGEYDRFVDFIKSDTQIAEKWFAKLK